MKIIFTGAGKMASAIASGLVRHLPPSDVQISAYDISEQSCSEFSSTTGLHCSLGFDKELLQNTEIVILAVKPKYAEAAVREFAPYAQDKLIISIAAGITLKSLQKWSNNNRIARVMPNTPLTIGMGASVFASLPALSTKDKDIVKQIFASSGIIFEVEETLIDPVTALSGSGPAYIFEMMDAMIDAGTAHGIPKEIAESLVIQTVRGSAEMLAKTKKSAVDLRNAVTSPGGTTEAALKEMNNKQFKDIIKTAIDAAFRRSVELGQEKS